jgi:hypothetical protein
MHWYFLPSQRKQSNRGKYHCSGTYMKPDMLSVEALLPGVWLQRQCPGQDAYRLDGQLLRPQLTDGSHCRTVFVTNALSVVHVLPLALSMPLAILNLSAVRYSP